MQTNKQLDQNNDLDEINEKKQKAMNELKQEVALDQQLNHDNLVKINELSPDFQQFRELVSGNAEEDEEWKLKVKRKNVKIWIKKVEDSPVYVAKYDGIFCQNKYDIETVSKILGDPQLRLKWDTVLTEYNIIEKINDVSDIVYMKVKTPPMFADRDHVLYRHYFNNKQHPELVKKFNLVDSPRMKIFIYSRSVEHPNCPPKKGIVRCDTFFLGMEFEECEDDPSKIRCVLTQHCDVKGRIPKNIFNYVTPILLRKLLEGFEHKYEYMIKKYKDLIASITYA